MAVDHDVPEAAVEGAVAFRRFLPTDEEEYERWFLAPDRPPAVFCDECGARRSIIRQRDREQGGPRDRRPCAPCAYAADVSPGVGPDWPGPKELASLVHDGVYQAWTSSRRPSCAWLERCGLPMPPHVLDSVARPDVR